MKSQRKIVFIMTDSQRADMLGCYGNDTLKTPYLDKLASEGTRFTKAYTCQPVCGPARSAIFTGLFPHQNGSVSNSVALAADVKTIGQRLSGIGMKTCYIGKWHLDGGDYFGNGECPDGWDKDNWYDMRNYLNELSSEDRVRSRNRNINAEGIDEDFTFGHRCSDRAIEFISKNYESDFFIAVSYDEPHEPCLCPEPYASMYKNYEFPKSENIWDTLNDKPEHQKIWAGKKRNGNRDDVVIKDAYYFGCNSFVDYEIGRVLECIDRYVPDALVIYTSDHGMALNSHCLSGKGPAMYDEVSRIPFIVRWSGVACAGIVCETPVSHIDLVPTILDAAGVKKPKTLSGESLVDILQSPHGLENRDVFMEFTRYEVNHDHCGGFQPIRCIFDGRFKLVINLMASDELYDLRSDPQEIHNLIEDEETREIRDSLHDRLLDWMNETRDVFRGYYWERRSWRKDARPATWGYTGMTRYKESEPGEISQLDYKTGLEFTSI